MLHCYIWNNYFSSFITAELEPEPSKQSYTDHLNKNLQLASSAASLYSLGVLVTMYRLGVLVTMCRLGVVMTVFTQELVITP